MRTSALALSVALLLATFAGSARADDADPLAAIDAALFAPPSDARLVREDGTAREVWEIGGAEPCKACGKPGPGDCPWVVEFGFALSLAQGNSDKLDLVLDGKADYVRDPWALKNSAKFVYAESDGVRSTEAWHTEHRVERKLSARTYVFTQVMFDRDELADLEYRFTGLVGIGRVLIETSRDLLKGEVGGGVVIEKRLLLPETSDPSAYLGLDYEHCWADGSKLVIAYDFIPNLSDFDLSVMTWDAKFTKPLSDKLDLTVGLRVDYVFQPPAPTESWDLLLAVGLRVKL
jgi:putative salt-induced outer membrane protein YdiY